MLHCEAAKEREAMPRVTGSMAIKHMHSFQSRWQSGHCAFRLALPSSSAADMGGDGNDSDATADSMPELVSDSDSGFGEDGHDF